MKLKNYLDKFQLKPENITETMLNIDIGTPHITRYYHDEYNGNKFIVLTGTDDKGIHEVTVGPKQIGVYFYKKGKTPKKDIPDFQRVYDKDGYAIHT